MTTTTSAAVGQEHAPENGYAAPANTGTAHKAGQPKMLNDTTLDALVGWFDLAKPARSRQQKKSWQKGSR